MTAGYAKPLPIVRAENREFWEAAKRHELRIQRCRDCGTYRWPPRPLCHQCQSANTEWVRSKGKGTIHSFTVIVNNEKTPVHPGFMKAAPFAAILVELADVGRAHIVSNIVGCKPEDISIGMPVEVVFDDVTSEITLPKFKPVA